MSGLAELECDPLDRAGAGRLLGIALSLAAAVDYKGEYRAHSQTVSELCHGIGLALGVTESALRRLTIAGMLHDVGKLQIADAILNKPSALSEVEWHVIRRHPLLGHETLMGLGLPDEARWVLHHHERCDGHGYPSGLKGEQIPIGSRILLAADAWECMTADRPYRPGMSMEQAGVEMLACVGTQFDPYVAEALLACVLAPGWRLPRLTVSPDRLMGERGIAPHDPHDPAD